MSHYVSIILINKSQLRNSKISSIIEEENYQISPYLELPQSMLAFPELSKKDICRYFGPGVKFIEINTDYFGGSGKQSAGLYETTESEFIELNKKSNDYLDSRPINYILKCYGVYKEGGYDEFDTINLGNYRSNEDFTLEIERNLNS